MQNGQTKRIFNKELLSITIDRLCYQLIENHNDFKGTVIIGIQSRGVLVSRRIFKRLQEINPNVTIEYGELDISFYRDDFRRRELIIPSANKMDIQVEGKVVVLVDDVLYTGRTIRAALDALLDFGRPTKVELLALIDRKFSRELPIAADYIGQSIDTIASEKVLVQLQSDDGDDGVWITSSETKL
jgi:pyrimidine operon attenuation protein/uracil phosphoribosyltransferase